MRFSDKNNFKTTGLAFIAAAAVFAVILRPAPCAAQIQSPQAQSTQAQATPNQASPVLGTVDDLKPSLKTYVKQVIPVIFALGDGDVKKAAQLLKDKMYQPDETRESSFGGQAAQFYSYLARFEAWKLDFESVDLVQYKPISSQSCSLMFIANGKSGPVIFVITAYEHRKKWQMNEFNFRITITQDRAAFANVKLAKPLSFKRSDYQTANAKTDSNNR